MSKGVPISSMHILTAGGGELGGVKIESMLPFYAALPVIE